MQSVITHPDGISAGANAGEAMSLIAAGSENLEAVVTRSKRLSATERLAIYGNAYYARLLECLGEVFPVLRDTLGEDVFHGFAFGYLQQFPPSSYTLHHLGAHFVEYLCATRPADSPDDECWTGFLIDLARLEWSIYEVFDGEGLEGAGLFDFSKELNRTEDELICLKFVTAPCLRLLHFDYPVNRHYSEMRAGKSVSPAFLSGRQTDTIAVTRRDYVVRRYSLTLPQFVMLECLQKGETLGDSLEACLEVCAPDQVEGMLDQVGNWFKRWGAEHAFFLGVDDTAVPA